MWAGFAGGLAALLGRWAVPCLYYKMMALWYRWKRRNDPRRPSITLAGMDAIIKRHYPASIVRDEEAVK